MSKKTRIVIIIFLIILMLIGTLVTVYPVVSAWLSNQVQSEIHTQYEQAIETVDTSAIDAAWEDAISWNVALFTGQIENLLTPEENGYYDILDITGNGIMGYINIPKINVSLPIYHGTSPAVLEKGAGHMTQSSFPVGGVNTHAAITAHSGMASNPMFSDLPLLQPGDTFYVEVLGEVLTYEIQGEDDIQIVTEYQIDGVQLQRGEDLVTLITCYPYGINSHRLLVRGHRIPTPVVDDATPTTEPAAPEENTDSIWLTEYQNNIVFGLSLAVLLCLILLLICVTLRTVNNRRAKHGAKKN